MAIKLDSEVLHGQPHIEGTRIGVADVLSELMDIEALKIVKRQYPQLSHSQIIEAVDYARKVMEQVPVIRAWLPNLEDD